MSRVRRGGAASGPARKANSEESLRLAVLAALANPDWDKKKWTMEAFANETFTLGGTTIQPPSLRTLSRNHWHPAQIRDQYVAALFGPVPEEEREDVFPRESWRTLPKAWSNWLLGWLPDQVQRLGPETGAGEVAVEAGQIEEHIRLVLQVLAYRPMVVVAEVERREIAQQMYDFEAQCRKILAQEPQVEAAVARQWRRRRVSIQENWLAYAEGLDTGPWTESVWPETEATREDWADSPGFYGRFLYRRKESGVAMLPRHWYWRARGAASVGDVDRMADAITRGRRELSLPETVDGKPYWQKMYASLEDSVDDVADLCQELAVASWRPGVDPAACRQAVKMMLPADLEAQIGSGRVEVFWWQAWANGNADRIAADVWPSDSRGGLPQPWEGQPVKLVLQYWAQTTKTDPDIDVAQILRPAAHKFLQSKTAFLEPAGLRAAMLKIVSQRHARNVRPYDLAEALPVLSRLRAAAYLGQPIPADVADTIKQISADIAFLEREEHLHRSQHTGEDDATTGP